MNERQVDLYTKIDNIIDIVEVQLNVNPNKQLLEIHREILNLKMYMDDVITRQIERKKRKIINHKN
jgi:hypothetical protein